MIKKGLSLLLFIGLLVGCSLNVEKLAIHDNIDDTLARDSVEALNILKKQARRSKPKYKEADAALLRGYVETYGEQSAAEGLSADELPLYQHIQSLIASFGPDAPLDEKGRYVNASHNFKWQQDIITDIIEQGFVLP